MQRIAIALGLFAAFVLACSKDKSSSDVTTTGGQPTGTTRAGGMDGGGKPVGSAKPPDMPAAGKPVVTWKDVGLVSPESVFHDAAEDVYFVSNVNGDPFAADGNGFVAKLSPDGKVVQLRFIDALNAPKGITVTRGNLYVSDIDRVRIFDAKTGKPKGEVVIPHGTFANDLAALPDGRVIASDTGLRAGKQSFEHTGEAGVYIIDKDDKTLTTVAKSKELGGPNGILALPDKTWVLGFDSGELYSLDLAKGTRADVQKLPKAALDGIVGLPNGDLVISSWDANGIYRMKPGGAPSIIVEGLKAPADIGYDAKRGRLLVPLFQDNEVRAYDVK